VAGSRPQPAAASVVLSGPPDVRPNFTIANRVVKWPGHLTSSQEPVPGAQPACAL